MEWSGWIVHCAPAKSPRARNGCIPGRHFLCRLFGHSWRRSVRTDRTILLTCKRCGYVDSAEKANSVLGLGHPPPKWK
jgi:hypothetical protein